MKAIGADTKSSVGSGSVPNVVEKENCTVRKEGMIVFGK